MGMGRGGGLGVEGEGEEWGEVVEGVGEGGVGVVVRGEGAEWGGAGGWEWWGRGCVVLRVKEGIGCRGVGGWMGRGRWMGWLG